jgi:hypothetical protein
VRDAVLPFSVEQYHKLGEAGIIAQDTELLRGVIVEKTVNSPEHSWLVQKLVDWLRATVPAGWHVRQEQPLTFADSEPEPDIASTPYARCITARAQLFGQSRSPASISPTPCAGS